MEIRSDFFKAPSFRTILVSEFEKRKARRPSYSLRAYARDLGVKSPTFGGVLRGRYGISEATARGFAEKLQFTADESEYFVALVKSNHARTKIERERAKLFLKKYRNVVEYKQMLSDQIEIFSNWYYPAVLELISINGGRSQTSKFATKLGITAGEVKKAVACLLRAKVLIHTEENRLERNAEHIAMDCTIPNQAIRGFHKQVIDRARTSIDQQPIEMRKYLSAVMSFNSIKSKEARERLEELYQNFMNEFGSSESAAGEADSVYAVGIQFFRLDAGVEK